MLNFCCCFFLAKSWEIVGKLLMKFIKLLLNYRQIVGKLLMNWWKIIVKLLSNSCKIVVILFSNHYQIVVKSFSNCYQNVGKLLANYWQVVVIMLQIVGKLLANFCKLLAKNQCGFHRPKLVEELLSVCESVNQSICEFLIPWAAYAAKKWAL